jgi:hypothetical protein
MSKGGIIIQAFAMKSRPDILIVQGESVGGHENTRETLEKKMGSGNVRNTNTCEHVFKRWGRSGVVLGSIWDLMGSFWRSGGVFFDGL